LIRLTAVAALALALAAPAHGARFAVGVERGVPLPRVAARLPGHVSYRLAPLRVLVVDAPSVRGVRRIPGVRYVEWLGTRSRRLAFTPNDPLAARQWYLQDDHAFDLWPEPPLLPPVRVGIIDSGIDGTHPEFAGKIVGARSFVGGSGTTDRVGHGTFVAGEIAAALNNNQGIAGIAFPAELLVAKVVRPDRSISLEAEAQAIRWAVDRGARVLNLSLGGLRDPRDPDRDTYSALEADAVDYAARHGVVLVAAVGNSDQAPQSPWPYASYPAALPHVLGVSAVARDGSVPTFSDRDPVYNDIAAPGQDLLSTIPLKLTRPYPTCTDQGYSDCGPDEYRHAEGTSFAAPQVTAAAALLLATSPKLTANQVTTVLERTADDLNASNGCKKCPLLRDALSGWGRLNIAKALGALAGTLPSPDRLETNDDVGPLTPQLFGSRGTVIATGDFWDDPIDVYRVRLRAGETLAATLVGPTRTSVELQLWKPRTPSVVGVAYAHFRAAQSVVRPSGRQQLRYRVAKRGGGMYAIEVRFPVGGSGRYALNWAKTRAAPA
jgi:subtilisin family serine protease